MRGLESILKMFRGNPNAQEAIRTLWREYYALYNEKYTAWGLEQGEASGSGSGATTRIPLWLRNEIAEAIDFGQAIGQDHQVNGNQSIAIGIGAITQAFREIVLGSYPSASTGSATEWVETDRLITIGNGTSEDSGSGSGSGAGDGRSDALIVFKSGLIQLFNALVIGDFVHGGEDPEPGTIRFKDSKFQGFIADWLTFLTDAASDGKQYARKDGAWVEVTTLVIQDISFEFADVMRGTAQTYTLDISAVFPYTIISSFLETDTGTLTGVSVNIVSTPVTSLSSITVDSAVDETTATGANAVAIGNRVTLLTSTGYTGNPSIIRGKLKILRT